MPVSEIDIAGFPTLRTNRRSVSMPVRRSQSRNPDLRDAVEHRRLRRAFWKKHMLGAGPKGAEKGRAEHKARDQLTDYRRLTHALHQFAEQPSAKNQDNDLRE